MFKLDDHGDSREKALWPEVSIALSQYERFWRGFIVLLTNRIDPNVPVGPAWIRLRSSIPREYEELAMYNYSLFYYAASARGQIEEDRRRMAAKQHPCPERVFFALRACTENEAKLRDRAEKTLKRLQAMLNLPPQPTALYESIRVYRNAFTHNPLLGRGITHGRELLPPQHRLPKKSQLVLWRDVANIPDDEMIDGLAFEERLWQDLAISLQKLWISLTEALVLARQQPQFIADLKISRFLPIQKPSASTSLAGPPAPSGTIIIARSDVP